MIEQRLRDLAIALPVAKKPVANYLGARQAGDLLFVSGRVSDLRGVVGAGVTVAQAYDAARRTLIDILAIVREEIEDLDRVVSVVKLNGFVRSAPDFVDQPLVIDGASDLWVDLLGEAGRHARTATGVSQLPFGAAVQLEMTLGLEPARAT